MPLHWAITEAIRNRDAQAAEAAMQKLVLLTADDIQRALNVDRVRKKGG
jgi:DNA-binding GntR family transcriptional regulator